MLIFIDESGDPGFKLTSSPCLIMTMVIFDDYTEADNTRALVEKLGKTYRIKPEYRFTNCSAQNRTAFFDGIRACKFRIRSIVMYKNKMHSHFLRNKPMYFYNYTLRQLLTHNNLANAKVRIDGNAKKEFLKAAKSYLRQQIPPGIVDNVKFLDSQEEPLIQLADMVTGAIARLYNRPDEPDADMWYRKLLPKIENIWRFN